MCTLYIYVCVFVYIHEEGRQGIQEHICYTKGRSWGGCTSIYIYSDTVYVCMYIYIHINT